MGLASEGVETVRATGDWKYASGEAQTDCNDKLKVKTEAKIKELERDGKEVTQEETFPLEEEKETVGNRVRYRYSGRVDLTWEKP